MSKRWNRLETWLTLIIGGAGLILLGVGGLWVFMSATATPLHPDVQAIESVTYADPAPDWGAAVEHGRRVVRAALRDQNLPGLSVAVGAGGEIVWAEGFGWADLDNRVPVEPETRFRMGTASKVLTSAAVGLLLEEGRLTLDDEIQRFVPEFPTQPWPVRLRHLMAHTAGLRNDGGDEGPLYSQSCERPVDALRLIGRTHGGDAQVRAGGALLFEPGTQYRYSNYGWILVSAAIEAAAGERFLAFMRERIFNPLRMHDTRADATASEIPDVATFYFPRFAADPRYGLHLMRDIDLSCYAGAGVFLSTPSDLVRFGIAVEGGKLLQASTVERLQAAQRLASGEETGYGLGWQLETVAVGGAQTLVVGHDGDVLGGQVASLMTLRDRGVVVAVMSNISYADTFALGAQLAEAFAERRTPPAGR